MYCAGIQEGEKKEIIDFLKYSSGSSPVRYLGVPLSSKKLTIDQCAPLINKITARIQTWTARMLSYSGRLQLIRAVLMGMQAFWTQLFILPQRIIKRIEAICRSFLWTGSAQVSKKALVAWGEICLPKCSGGMNLMNLKIWNQAAITKLLWAMYEDKEKLWVRWVQTYYIKNQDVRTMSIPQQAAWIIRKIINMRKFIPIIGSWSKVKKNGKYSIKEVYKMLSRTHEKVHWKSIICGNKASPRIVFIAWLALNGKLYTKEKVATWNTTVDQTCVLCSENNETIVICSLIANTVNKSDVSF